MAALIDRADRAFWWLRAHPAVAAVTGVLTVALIAGLVLAGRGRVAAPPPRALPAGAVATVGDLPITRAALDHWRGIYLRTASGTPRPTARQATTAAFELLAGSAWIAQEARRRHVSVTGARVAQAAADYLTRAAAATRATRAQILSRLGTTEGDVRFQQRAALLAAALQQQIVGALPAVTGADVRAAYTAEPQRWARPSRRDARALITATRPAATAALAALRRGASFAAVTGRYSSSSALSGTAGVLRDLRPGTNDAAVERPLFAAPAGVLRGPFAVSGGWLVFRVQRITPLPPQDLPAAAPAIRRDLAAAAQSAAVDGYLTALRRRWQPQTRCSAAVTSAAYCRAT